MTEKKEPEPFPSLDTLSPTDRRRSIFVGPGEFRDVDIHWLGYSPYDEALHVPPLPWPQEEDDNRMIAYAVYAEPGPCFNPGDQYKLEYLHEARGRLDGYIDPEVVLIKEATGTTHGGVFTKSDRRPWMDDRHDPGAQNALILQGMLKTNDPNKSFRGIVMSMDNYTHFGPAMIYNRKPGEKQGNWIYGRMQWRWLPIKPSRKPSKSPGIKTVWDRVAHKHWWNEYNTDCIDYTTEEDWKRAHEANRAVRSARRKRIKAKKAWRKEKFGRQRIKEECFGCSSDSDSV